MNPRSESEPADPRPSTPPEAEGSSRRERPSALTLLLVSLWVGLTAGFLDLGFTILKKHLIDGEDFYRLGEGFPWIIPAGVAGLVLLPGAVLALAARLRGSGLPLGLAVAILSFVGALDLCALLPLDHWASVLLSAGVAVQAARLVRRRPSGFLRLVRLTCPVLAGAVADPRRGDLRRPRLVRASGGGRAATSAARGPQRPARSSGTPSAPGT